MLLVRAVGKSELQTATATVTPAQEIVFATALYLALESKKPTSREALASLLWPRAGKDVRGHRLRQTILQLKKLGFSVRGDRLSVWLSEELVSDFDSTLARLQRGPMDLSAVSFLPDYRPSHSSEFSEWVDSKREEAHTAFVRTLLPVLDEAKSQAKWTKVEEIARCCLRLDPYNEHSVLACAEALAMKGEKRAAVRLLDRYVKDVGGHKDISVPAKTLRARIRGYEPLNVQAVAMDTPLVGRERELSVLSNSLLRAVSGYGTSCMLMGDAGIGKSRLCSELARFAQLHDVRTQRIGCKPADSDQPLSAFVKLIPSLKELPGALGCSQETLTWLRRLTQFDGEEVSGPRYSDEPVASLASLRRAVFDLLDAVSDEQCLLLIIEDIQWIDDTSAKLFTPLIEWIENRPIFLLFNCRSGEGIGLISDRATKLSTMTLERLDPPQSESLIRAITRSAFDGVDAEELQWLVGAGDGNPFFLQELTRQWLDTGRQHEAPQSVADLLTGRLSRLSPSAQQVLEAIVLLGDNCTVERIEAVLEYPAFKLYAAIQELSTWGMLRSDLTKRESTTSLICRHDLLATAVISRLAPAALSYLHRRCGLVLEKELLGDSVSATVLRSCAFHWHQSGDSDRAYSLALKCANHFLEIGFAHDAVAVLDGALTHCSTIAMQTGILTKIAQAQFVGKEWAAVLKTIDHVRELSVPCLGHAHDDLEVLEFEARRHNAVPIRELLATTARCIDDETLTSQHRAKVAGLALKLGTNIPDFSAIRRIYRVVRPLLGREDVDERTRLLVEVVYATMCGDLGQAAGLADRRVELERESGTPAAVVNAIADLSFVLRRTGPIERIEPILLNAYDFSVRHNLGSNARDFASRMMALLIDTQRYDVGEWLERSIVPLEHENQAHIGFLVHRYRARIALHEGRLDDASRFLAQAFDRSWLEERQGWLAASLALQILIGVASHASSEQITVSVGELHRLYNTIAPLGGLDYEVAALCEGLEYVGEEQRSEAVFADYLVQRRDLTPYSMELIECARRIERRRTLTETSPRSAASG